MKIAFKNICAAALCLLTVLGLCACAKPSYTTAQAKEKYQNGDFSEALKMFEALANDDGEAACYAGCMYYSGEGTSVNKQKAKEYFEISAKAENLNGIYNLGICYEDQKDYKTAKEYYEKAAYKGDANAIGALGAFYEKGLGVAVDYAHATEYYKVSAAKGNVASMMRLAEFYEKGIGVTKDINAAKDYYKAAADSGSDEAAKKLEQLQ